MPTYAYKCEECKSKFEIFHKVKEKNEDVKCPQCESTKYNKLMSAVSINGFSTSVSPANHTQSSTYCSSGLCGLN